MHTLHIITPSHATTSQALVGLMRLTQMHLGGTHQTIVIGNQVEVTNLRNMGVVVLGSLDGPNNSSNTLGKRLQSLVNTKTKEINFRIIAWGWHGATVASSLEVDCEIFAIIDEIDKSCSMANSKLTIVPTNWNCSKRLCQLGVPSTRLTEPLIGVEPSVLVVDKKSTRKLLHVEQTSFVVSIVGIRSSWQDVLSMAVRLKSANQHVDFILPASYEYRSQLMMASKQQGLSESAHDTPDSLRTVDVVKASDCVWVPDVSSYDESYGVLDVVSAAWEGVPLAVGVNHSASSIPTIGQQIAWVRDELDVTGWILDLANGFSHTAKHVTDQSSNIRMIASPLRFVDGLVMRM